MKTYFTLVIIQIIKTQNIFLISRLDNFVNYSVCKINIRAYIVEKCYCVMLTSTYESISYELCCILQFIDVRRQ